MYRLRASILFALLPGILLPLFAQSTGVPTNHTREVFRYDLATSSSDIGTVINSSGSFISGQGWRPSSTNGQLKIALKDFLPYEGTLEVKVTGLSAAAVTKDWIPFSIWSRSRGKFYQSDGSSYPSEGAYAFIKTDAGRATGDQLTFKLFTKSMYDPIKANHLSAELPTYAYSATKEYTLRFVWRPGGIWYQVYLGGAKLVEASTFYSMQCEAFDYIFVGRSNEYSSMTGITYKDLVLRVPETSVWFKDVTRSSRTLLDSTLDAQSLAWGDVNQDGREDLYVNYYNTANLLYLANGDSGNFNERGNAYNLASTGSTFSSVMADFNNDGKTDIFVANLGSPHQLFINQGGGLFEDQAGSRGISTSNGNASNALVFDMDNDGDMDIFVANSGSTHELYINQLNGNFTKFDVTTAPVGTGARAVAGDVNGDNYPDIFYPRRNATAVLLINNKSGSFNDEAGSRGLAITTDPNAPTLVDLDNDGDLDLVLSVASFSGDGKPQVLVYQNNGSGVFTKVNSYLIDCYGAAAGDVDNDGLQDLYLPRRNKYSADTYDYSSLIYRNTTVSSAISLAPLSGTGAELVYIDGRGSAMADYNNDGKLDIFTTAKGMTGSNSRPYGRSALLMNNSQNSNNYLRVVVTDRNGTPYNYGSKIRVYRQGFIGQSSQLIGYREITSIQGYQSLPSPIQHFGLGANTAVDVQIELANKRTFNYSNVLANTLLTVNPYRQEAKELQMVKGDGQSRQVTTTLPDSVIVRVLDIDNQPLSGQTVTFKVTQGGGAVNGANAVLDVTTDAQGLARVAWTLGTVAGDRNNQLEVSAFKNLIHITGSPLTFYASATPGTASRMNKESGDGQLGYAGDPLTNPLIIKVMDLYNNAISGYNVSFEIAQGGGGLGAAGTSTKVDLVTAADGTAQTSWRLGSAVGTQKVNAYGAFNMASPAVFSATAQEPQRRLTYESGDRQSATVNTTLRDPITARLRDYAGTPIVGGKVRFAVISGGGKINGQSSVEVTTGANGLAAVTPTLGTAAGDTNNVFQATSTGAQGTITYKITALPGTATQLTEVSGNNRTGKVGRLLSSPFVVRVTDAYGNAVNGFQVNFSVTTGNGTVNGQASTQVATDLAGYASVLLRLGNSAGINTVSVSAISLAGSPITFTATGEASSPALMYKISGDNQKGSLGQQLPLPMVIAVNDSFSNPVNSQPVTFRVTKGTGLVEGQNATTVSTNALGRASVNFTLGTSGFQNEITVTSQYLGVDVPTYPTPLFFTASTGAGNPDTLIYISGNHQVGQINSPLPQPFQVKITDRNGVPISNHAVSFYAISPGGNFSGAAYVTKRTDENGLVSAVASIGSNYGDDIYSFEARADYNSVPLRNSPYQFYASGRRTTATQIKYVYGNNLTGVVGQFLADSLKVRAVDALDQPVANQPVTFEVTQGSGTLNGSSNSMNVLTGANGLARVALKLGSTPGKVKIRALADDGLIFLTGSPIEFEVTAVIGPPDRARSTMTATTPVIADGVQTSKVMVTLRDAEGNLVSGKIVSIYTAGLEVRVNQPALATDANGQTQGTVSAVRAGTAKIWTMVDSRQVPSDTARVTFKAGPANRAVPFGSGQIALRSTTLPLPVGIYLYDANSNPVPNTTVSFRIKSGGGSIVQSQPIVTDTNGRAQVNWILGSQIGEQYVTVVVPDIGGGEIEFWAIATPPAPATLSIIRGNKQIGLTNRALPDSFVVSVRDSTGAPAEGLSVYYSVTQGQGTFLSPNPVTTDRRGYAPVLFQSGASAGNYKVLATMAAGLSVEFEFIVQTEPTVFLSKLTDAKATIRPKEEQQIQLQVKDAWNLPIAGQAVTFEVLEGGGSVAGAMPMNTDSEGKALVRWTAGSKGTQKVKASPSGKAGGTLLFTSMVSNSAPVVTAPTEKTILAGDLLTFNITAYDADGDGITFGVRALPSGATFDSTGSRQFSWRPSRSQANKDYVVHFIARDQYLAADTADVKIRVQSLNQAPSIDSFEPADTTLTRYYNQPITFKILASDVDNDDLTYEWWINDLFAGTETILIFQPEPDYFPAENIVSITVSDGKVSKTLRWHVHLQASDAVRLSAFQALPQKTGILLKWQTAGENDNLGFKVLRSESEKGVFEVISAAMIPANSTGFYSYFDDRAQAGGTYYYKLQDVDRGGLSSMHGPVSAMVPLPASLALAQNYPNPFNPTTTICYELPAAAEVELTIFNIAGQRIRSLVQGDQTAGLHQVVWDGRDDQGISVPSGVYCYRMRSGGEVFTKKLLLAK